MFNKSLSELVHADLIHLIDEKIIEGINIEFKETLPSKTDKDPWIDGKDKIGDYARNQLLEEIISFANAYGGILLIGVSESKDNPSYATRINEIPKCKELAERIKLQCRDCIEPQIPLIETAGIETNEKGDGVVVIQVPKSRLAPHRHTVTKECYIRRADRAEKMSMREIQDLTLSTERGLGKIESLFNERKDLFDKKIIEFRKDATKRIFGVRVSAKTLTDVYVDDVFNRNDIKNTFNQRFNVKCGNSNTEIYTPCSVSYWRPILRGAKTEEIDEENSTYIELLNTGFVEISAIFSEWNNIHILYPSWFIGILINVLLYLHKIRIATGTHDLEAVLEIQINNKSNGLEVPGYNDHSYRTFGNIKESNTVFPKYSIGNLDTFEKLCNIIERDFWNHAGYNTNDEDQLEIDFNSLLN